MMFKDKYINRFYAFALAAVFALTLAGCGGGGGTAAVEEEPPPMPTPEEMCTAAGNQYVNGECLTPAQVTINTALANIAAATTAEDAQAAYDAVKDDVTATAGEMLQAAVNARIMAIEMAARVDAQKMALADAAGMIDTSDLSTQAAVDAARMAIEGLRGALADADDVSDADKAMYMSQLDDAVAAVNMAQGGIDTATRRMNQMDALSGASMRLQAALAALSGSTPTQAQLDAANSALMALNDAIAGGGDLTDDEKAPYQREANNAAAPIQTAKDAKDDADNMAAMQEAAAMAATAAKLYAGISEPKGDIREGSTFAVDDRTASYNVANTADDPANGVPGQSLVDTLIMVSIGDGSDTAHTAAVPLSEDKKTMVAKLHGWAGKRYTAEPDGDGTYEAMVYSNVGEPTQGKKFGAADTSDEFEYLLADGELALDQTTNPTRYPTSNVAIPGFDLTAGTKEYPLPENRERVIIPGSYHGVPGNFYCVAGTASTCAVRLAANGFRLGETADGDNAFTQTGTGATGGTWTFKPADPNARVMGMPDAIYASYGWWIHKSEDGNTFTASAFVDNKGAVPAAADLDNLQGTATYMGGAAGKYALSSSTGGTNDAGHFTARATLNADFSDNKITGTIDMFKGADGMDRDWSVELKEADVGPSGVIGRAALDDTVWTIGGTAAAASGWWAGTLYDTAATETDASGVPKVGTGTFYTEYGSSGKMVGAFGVNKQQ